MKQPTPLRFFALVLRPSSSLMVAAVALVGFGAYLARMDPADFDQTLGLALFLQMFAAATGFRERLTRGHFDPLLVGRANRASVACAHWTISMGPGVIVWLALAALDLFSTSPHWPVALSAAGVLAIAYVSTMAWVIALPLVRYAAGVLWMALLIGLAVSHRASTLTDIFTAAGSSWSSTLQAGAVAMLFPIVLVSDPRAASRATLTMIAAATLVAGAVGVWMINRFDGTLTDPS